MCHWGTKATGSSVVWSIMYAWQLYISLNYQHNNTSSTFCVIPAMYFDDIMIYTDDKYK